MMIADKKVIPMWRKWQILTSFWR